VPLGLTCQSVPLPDTVAAAHSQPLRPSLVRPATRRAMPRRPRAPRPGHCRPMPFRCAITRRARDPPLSSPFPPSTRPPPPDTPPLPHRLHFKKPPDAVVLASPFPSLGLLHARPSDLPLVHTDDRATAALTSAFVTAAIAVFLPR
jgi:hypothetical protein